MEIINLYLHSEIATLITINGTFVGSILHNSSRLHIQTDEPNIFITCYPIKNSSRLLYLPYTISLINRNNKLFCSDNTTYLTQLQPNCYTLRLCPQKIDITKSTDIYITQENLTFSLHNNIACFINANRSIFYPISQCITDVKIENTANKFFLNATTSENKAYALILNSELNIIFENTADKIEFDGNKVITLTNLHTIAQHGKVCVYTFSNGSFHKTQSYTVYIKTVPTPPATKEAIPTAFLEAVSLKDVKLARQYLHPNLNSLLDDNAIIQFFGDFMSFMPDLDNNPFNMSLIYESTPKFVKYFYFTVQNNLITNISAK